MAREIEITDDSYMIEPSTTYRLEYQLSGWWVFQPDPNEIISQVDNEISSYGYVTGVDIIGTKRLNITFRTYDFVAVVPQLALISLARVLIIAISALAAFIFITITLDKVIKFIEEHPILGSIITIAGAILAIGIGIKLLRNN